MNADQDPVERYLDEVAALLGPRKGKHDLMLELRSAILDRAEDLAGGEPDPESIRRALAAMGDPADVALAYAGERVLIGPRYYRPFLTYTGIVFLIHLVMILVASVTEVGIEVFPVRVLPSVRPHSMLNLVFIAVQALLVDIGLMVVIFAGVARIQRTVRLPRMVFRVQTGLRVCVTRVILAALVLVLLNFLRDRFFLVVDRGRVHPLFTHGFVSVLPILSAFLVAIMAKELAYVGFGERRWLVASDAVLAAAGAAMMVWFLTRPAFVAFPLSLRGGSDLIPTLNQLTAKVVQLLIIAFAAAFAWEAGKRITRLVQLW